MHETQQRNNFGTNPAQRSAVFTRGQNSDCRQECEPLPATIFPKAQGWQKERLRHLSRICRCLDRGQLAGKPIRKQIRLHAWHWRARYYRIDPLRKIHLKAATIDRIYRLWRNSGGSPSAIALHYFRGNRNASIGKVTELSNLCLAKETMSFSAAYRKLATPGANEFAYRYAVPARLRTALAALLVHRRQQRAQERALERAARKLLEGLAS